jgi:hypothetical protein
MGFCPWGWVVARLAVLLARLPLLLALEMVLHVANGSMRSLADEA